MTPYTPSYLNVIPANSDLNSYTNPGAYYCSSASDVATISNCPVGSAFRLDVVDIKIRASTGRYNYGYQEVKMHSTPWRVYRRRIATGSTAGAWEYGAWYVIEGTAVS